MTWLTKNLKQVVTLWETNGTFDANGQPNFNAPIQITARWEDEEVTVKNSRGEEKEAKTAVYIDRTIQEGSYLFLGSSVSADPRTVAGARPVTAFSSVPSLDATKFERIAFL